MDEKAKIPFCGRGTDSAKVIQVIETRTPVGLGTPESPVYILRQFWSLDGELLAQTDKPIV